VEDVLGAPPCDQRPELSLDAGYEPDELLVLLPGLEGEEDEHCHDVVAARDRNRDAGADAELAGEGETQKARV
jgi:hypothetical protein